MKLRVDLNCDLGEGGQWDESLLEYITSANIACGVHAGSPALMRKTVQIAIGHNVGLGAHPGMADKVGMGRRETDIKPQDAFDLVTQQVIAMQAVASAQGQKLQHVKPHGALYNMAARDKALAEAIAQAVAELDKHLILFGSAGGESVIAGKAIGLTIANEAFADRTYQGDGTLTPRTQPNALINDPDLAARRAVRLVKERKLLAADGRELSIQSDTLCVHGDSPNAVAILRRLREVFRQEGIELRRIGQP